MIAPLQHRQIHLLPIAKLAEIYVVVRVKVFPAPLLIVRRYEESHSPLIFLIESLPENVHSRPEEAGVDGPAAHDRGQVGVVVAAADVDADEGDQRGGEAELPDQVSISD